MRSARQAAGLSQRELARISGVAQPNIAAYETGRRVPTDAMVARLLDNLRERPSARLAHHRDDVLRAVVEHRASNARVFGSVARGDDRLFNLTAELTRLLGTAVDVVSDRGLRSRDDQIRAEAVAL